MQFTPAALDAAFYNIRMDYQAAYDSAKTWYEQVATKVPSAGRENRYAWMKLIPRLREWVGERKFNNLTARAYTLANKDYEDSIAIDRNDFDDNNLGVYKPAATALGDQAKRWPDDLVATALQAGTTALCYDGQPFFSASHPVDSDDSSLGTFSNLRTGTALTPANYSAERARMAAYVGEDNRPMGVMANLLVVPPALETTARQILQAEYIAPVAALGGNAASIMQSNVMRGTAELLVVPELGNEPGVWYLADTRKPIKGLIFQERKAPEFAQQTESNSESVFLHKEYRFGVDARGNAGYSLPFLMLRAAA